ncbi:MAG: lipoate--protein ligase [Ruminococcaceae bacterium]|nr:lipoate--protein ligase [Oscillospiraceae bacterium]
MKLYVLTSTDPYYNLAVEEYLFRNEQEDVFMLWQNEPTVVIGKNQNAFAEVELDALRQDGVHLARRITGGGAVYHDLGNVNFSFISAQSTQTGLDFAGFTAPILAALHSLGVNAELSGRNDLLLEGKKFSGNAQHTANGRTLHHGTLLFDSDLSALSRYLRPDEEKLKSKGIKSVRSRVTNLKPFLQISATTGAFIEHLAQFLRAEYAPTEPALPQSREIDALCARNASREWLFPERELVSAYTLHKKARFPFGTVEISLSMHNEIMTDAIIRGDFFGTLPIEELESAFRQKTLAELPSILSKLPLSDYVSGLQLQDLLHLLEIN